MGTNSESKLGRRQALQLVGAGSVAAAGAFALTACGDDGGGGEKSADGKGCDAPIPQDAQQMRETLQYKDKSPHADKTCSNCAQYEKDKFGECGGCKLFGGPVQPGGHCLSWAEMGAGSAGTKATEG